MILTGKAKEDFENGIIEILKKNYNEKLDDNKRAIDWIYDSNDLILFAHIIEWFDSVGIYIHVDNLTNVVYQDLTHGWASYIKRDYKNRIRCIHHEKTRHEATEQAIIKANEIYNNLNK